MTPNEYYRALRTRLLQCVHIHSEYVLKLVFMWALPESFGHRNNFSWRSDKKITVNKLVGQEISRVKLQLLTKSRMQNIGRQTAIVKTICTTDGAIKRILRQSIPQGRHQIRLNQYVFHLNKRSWNSSPTNPVSCHWLYYQFPHLQLGLMLINMHTANHPNIYPPAVPLQGICSKRIISEEQQIRSDYTAGNECPEQ